MKINKDNLEKALSKQTEQPQISKESSGDDPAGSEEIGFHKGALNTLANERNEIFKMIQNVEVIMQAHLKRLEELGVKIQQEKK